MLVTLEHYPAGGIPRPRMQLYRLASSTRCCEQKHGVSRVTPRPMFASFHVRSEQIAPVSSLSLSFPLPLLLPFPSPPLILPFLSSPSLFAHILLCPNPLPSPKQKTAKPTPAWTHQEPKQTGHCSNSPPPYMHYIILYRLHIDKVMCPLRRHNNPCFTTHPLTTQTSPPYS